MTPMENFLFHSGLWNYHFKAKDFVWTSDEKFWRIYTSMASVIFPSEQLSACSFDT